MDGHLWYFAYGSNLDPETFRGRRRMQPLGTRMGCVRGYRLAFDLPVGAGERGVANLVSDSQQATWGAAYEISAAQAGWLDRTEGVPSGVYDRIGVEVETHAGAALEAFTYVSRRGVAGRKPSPRYMSIVLAGARHHALPASWIEWLESLELAVDERSA